LLSIAVLVVIAGAGRVRAGTILSFVGDLRNDANFVACGSGCTLGALDSDSDYAQWAAVQRNFTVAKSSNVQAVSFSYGGGINGNGGTIAPGGFEPYLSLFDASGNFIASTFVGVTCPAGAQINNDSGQCFDVLLDAGVLAPGNYAITISAFENMSFAENSGTGSLADGFTGLGNLTPSEDMHYAFDVTIQDTSAVPEPATWSLLGCAALLASGIAAGSRIQLKKQR